MTNRETASIDFADLLRRWERNEPDDVAYVWQFVDYLIELASLRSQTSTIPDNHARDAERMQGIRERAERYANGGHRFEPRDVIYVLCELDVERQRAARELAASKHCEKHPEPYTCCGVAQSYELMLDAERQRADAAEHAANEMSARWNSILNAKKAAEKLIEQYKQNVAEHLHCKMEEIVKHPCPHIGQRDRRIAELEAALRRAKDALVTEGVCEDGDSVPWLDAALTTSASPEPVSKSVAKRHAIMREAREDDINLSDPGNNLVDESPTTSAKLNGTVEDCDPRQVDRNVSLDTHKEPK